VNNSELSTLALSLGVEDEVDLLAYLYGPRPAASRADP